MQLLKNLVLFHCKLIFITLPISVLLTSLGIDIGLSYVIITPAYHFFLYETVYPNEYYYYCNLGLSRLVLWITTILFSCIFCFLIAIT